MFLENQRPKDCDDVPTSCLAKNQLKHSRLVYTRRVNGPPGLKCEEYAVPQTNWASLPFVVTCGDPLQFPPVPACSSLLADPENTSREHRAAEQMFADQDYVCKLSTAMRFENDPTLQRILEKMRTPGEDRTNLMLTAHEWKVLQSTDIEHGASLEGTEMWHQAGYPWTIVCMAQWVRSQLSAAHHKATLFLCPAKDYIQNVEQLDLLHVRNELIKFPNMNKTGRLPGISLLHLHMRVRITATICPRLAPVDTSGTIVNIELEGTDRIRMEKGDAPCILLLQRQPIVLVRLDESVEDRPWRRNYRSLTHTHSGGFFLGDRGSILRCSKANTQTY